MRVVERAHASVPLWFVIATKTNLRFFPSPKKKQEVMLMQEWMCRCSHTDMCVLLKGRCASELLKSVVFQHVFDSVRKRFVASEHEVMFSRLELQLLRRNFTPGFQKAAMKNCVFFLSQKIRWEYQAARCLRCANTSISKPCESSSDALW